MNEPRLCLESLTELAIGQAPENKNEVEPLETLRIPHRDATSAISLPTNQSPAADPEPSFGH